MTGTTAPPTPDMNSQVSAIYRADSDMAKMIRRSEATRIAREWGAGVTPRPRDDWWTEVVLTDPRHAGTGTVYPLLRWAPDAWELWGLIVPKVGAERIVRGEDLVSEAIAAGMH